MNGVKQWIAKRIANQSLCFVLCLSVAFLCPAEQAQDVREAIVKIYTVHNSPDYYNPWNMRGPRSSTGSGCIIEGNRILTNGHVVHDHTFIQVRRFGESRRYQARVLFVSHQADLALLSVDDPAFFNGVQPLAFGELPATQEEVHVYGFPLGGDTLSITKGVISRIEHQTYVHSSVPLLAAQIDAAINPGNSGGPALTDGRIVGVAMQGIPRADNIGYIVPVPVIHHFLTDIENDRLDGIPGLGIFFQKMENPDLRRRFQMEADQTGVLIVEVIHGSATDGLLRAGDVLLTIDGEPIADDGTIEFRPKERTQFSYLTQKRQIGESVELTLLREGKELTLPVDLPYPLERNWLVPMERYDVEPDYYIYGGVVFVPLTKNLMQMWGSNWFNTAPKEFTVQLQNNQVTEERDELVVALHVLAADVNQGYHEESRWLIEKVDGMPVRNLRHLIEQVETGEGNEFVEFRSFAGQKMIFDRDRVRTATPSILATYRITSDRSQSLQTPAAK